jgi:hypothetical protein
VEITEMKSESNGIRNPFGVMNVPNPNDQEVLRFSASAMLDGSPEDENAKAWSRVGHRNQDDMIEGEWSSRWNGGVDDTIPEDAREKWKQGRGEVRVVGDRVYLLFDWDSGKRRGLIDARRDGANKLVGKYINLTNQAITRPWTGFVVNNGRIDGRWPGGRLDFRR